MHTEQKDQCNTWRVADGGALQYSTNEAQVTMQIVASADKSKGEIKDLFGNC